MHRHSEAPVSFQMRLEGLEAMGILRGTPAGQRMILFHVLLYLHPIFIPQYTSPSLSHNIYIYIYLSIYIHLSISISIYIYIYTSVYIYIIYIYIFNIYIIHMHIIHIYIYIFTSAHTHTHIYIYSDGNNIHTNTASSNLINAPQNLAISRSRCPCPACRWAATDCASPSVTGRKREQMVDTLQKKLR